MSDYTHAVALTGGIATGKSSAASLLKLHGFSVIDADSIAHEILEQESPAIIAHFGDSITAQGVIDRKKLGALIFSDPKAKQWLESLLHPNIREKIAFESRQLESYNVPYLVDIPLFFETRAYPIDRSIVVYTPSSIQKKRLMLRDGLGESEANRRITSQMDIETKKSLATWVIDNSADLKQLQSECEYVSKQLKNTNFS